MIIVSHIYNCLNKPYTNSFENQPYSFRIRSEESSSTITVPISKYLSYHNLSLIDDTYDINNIELYKSLPPQSSKIIEVIHPNYGYPEYGCLHEYMFVI